MDYVGEPNIITKFLKRGREENQIQRRCDNGSRAQRVTEDAKLVALKMKERLMSQGLQAASTSGKSKETDSPLEPPGVRPCWHLNFRVFDLQTCKIRSLCCFKALSLW